MIAEVRKDVPCLDLIKETWPTFQSNFPVTLGVPALLCFVPLVLVVVPVGIGAFVVAGGAAMTNKSTILPALIPVALVGMLLFAVVYNAIRVGWTKMLLSLVAGEPTKFSQVVEGKRWFVNFLIVNLIIGVGCSIGGMMLIVPGVFFAVRTSLAPFLVVDRNMGPLQAMVASNEMVTGYSWQVVIYFVLYGAANMVAQFLPIVGWLLPVPVMGFFDIVLAKIYMMRKQPLQEALIASA